MSAFFDKAKQVAQQAIDEAKKGVEQGQAKLDEASSKREATRLLSALGAAFYAEQRTGGDRAEVDAALQAVDNHVTVNGTDGFPGEDSVSETPAAAGTAPASDAPPAPRATGQTAPPDAPRPPGM